MLDRTETAEGPPPGTPAILPGTTVGGAVGTFYVDFTLWNLARTRFRTLNGLVDTGASYAQAPASLLEELGVEREQTNLFTLADGSKREFSIGWVDLELEGRFRGVYVIFGDEGGKVLLGSMALGSFGLAADAGTRRLIPGELTL